MNWVGWLAKSPLKRHLVSQLGRPRGPLGRALGRTMNRSNLKMSRHALEALKLQAGQTVLEVGFGGGVALPLLLETVGPQGAVLGLDRAPAMVAQAKGAFAAEIAAGRLSLMQAELPAMPAGFPPVDGILAVNVVYFWTEPLACVQALAAVLKPGGRISLGFRPPEVARVMGLDKAGFNTVEPETVLGWLKAAGLEKAHIQSVPEGKFLALAAVAIKPN
jgi:SAM-dependent methyltransferase